FRDSNKRSNAFARTRRRVTHESREVTIVGDVSAIPSRIQVIPRAPFAWAVSSGRRYGLEQSEAGRAELMLTINDSSTIMLTSGPVCPGRGKPRQQKQGGDQMVPALIVLL